MSNEKLEVAPSAKVRAIVSGVGGDPVGRPSPPKLSVCGDVVWNDVLATRTAVLSLVPVTFADVNANVAELTGTAAPATKPTVAPTPMAPQNSADTFEATGTVIAKLAGRNQLLIDHEDIPGFMSAMTMAFTLSDPAAMETVTEGDKVRFNLDKVSGHIVRIDKAGAPTAAASNSPEPGAYPSEAITLGRDLDGDGDADEVHIRLEVVEMEQEIWPGELLNFWVFAPISKGMISNARAPSPTIRCRWSMRPCRACCR